MKLRTAFLVLIAILFTFLPYHTFLVTSMNALFFDPRSGPPFLLSAWKEIILLAITVIFGILLVRRKISLPKLNTLDAVILLYILWALASGVYRWGTDFERIIWGAKYSLSFLFVFLIFRHFHFTEKEKDGLFSVIFGSAAVVLFFGVLQKFLPQDFLVQFGYSPDFSTFDPHGPISYCQKISFTDTCRLQSLMSGPNQFSAFLLLILPLYFFLAAHSYGRRKNIQRNASFRAFGATMFVIGLFCLFFAYSRSSWGGALISFAVGFIILFREKRWFSRFLVSSLILGLLAGISVFVFAPEFIHDVIIRGSSTQGHFERSRDGIEHIMMHPWGTGLGDSGPASARFYENNVGFIPESWYLQVGIDTGFPGLILFLMILFFLGRELLKSKDWRGQALFVGLIGISIMAIKLHSWESSEVAYTFWGLSGIVLAEPEKRNILKKALEWIRKFVHRLRKKKKH